MGRKKPEIESVNLDFTSMIDVVFLLLIFFACTIKFKTLEGKLITELPKDVGVNPTPAEILIEKIEIDIAPDKSREGGVLVKVNGKAMPNFAAFRTELGKRRSVAEAADQKARATLYPDVKINYEQVIKVVDQCMMAELTDITFAGVAFDK